jgi:hypothetical protein
MTNEDQRDQLIRESKLGEQANMAWMHYMKKYTEDKQKELYQEFLDAPLEAMVLVKYKQMALDQVVSGILLAIETGKLADKQLEEK